ncbi:MAG: AlpA family phage regulatory protein, partial [Betaproteobacteria bacterium]|nr:AlpA family phage regulatory protein [Betaproteobacteria bacterium]
MKHALSTGPTPPLSLYPDQAFVRAKTLIELGLIPFSPSTLHRKIEAGTFPVPVSISANITAFRWGDIKEWLADPA